MGMKTERQVSQFAGLAQHAVHLLRQHASEAVGKVERLYRYLAEAAQIVRQLLGRKLGDLHQVDHHGKVAFSQYLGECEAGIQLTAHRGDAQDLDAKRRTSHCRENDLGDLMGRQIEDTPRIDHHRCTQRPRLDQFALLLAQRLGERLVRPHSYRSARCGEVQIAQFDHVHAHGVTGIEVLSRHGIGKPPIGLEAAVTQGAIHQHE
ncbi:MAG: hypothetical protein GAK37_03740 [Pseudomonas sp.]|nr:MAG: hypothetical protein GAK37_03740 [Pseudomonas sp.]